MKMKENFHADLVIPFNAMRGQESNGQTFGSSALAAATGWVQTWNRVTSMISDPLPVMRANLYHYQNGWTGHDGPKHVAHVCSGWSKTDCDGVTPEADGSYCNEQHIPYSFGVLVMVA